MLGLVPHHPARAPLAGFAGDAALGPALLTHHAVEHLMRREMPEVQVRREPTGDVGFRLVVQIAIPRKPVGDEGVERVLSRVSAAAHGHGGHVVIDRQCSYCGCGAAEQCR